MKKGLCALILLSALLSFAYVSYANGITTATALQIGQTKVRVEGRAEVPFSNITMVVVEDGESNLKNFVYLRQTMSDSAGRFSFEITLASEEHKTYRVNLSSKDAPIYSDLTFTLSDEYEEDTNETTNRTYSMTLDVSLIANTVFVKGAVAESEQINNIAFAVMSEDESEYYAFLQRESSDSGEIDTKLILNPALYADAQSAILRIGGADINIKRYTIPLFSQESLERALASAKAIKSFGDFTSFVSEHGETFDMAFVNESTLSTMYYDRFLAERENTELDTVSALCEVVRGMKISVGRVQDFLVAINSASQSKKWSTIEELIQKTYKDLLSCSLSTKGVTSKKEMYQRMVGKTYESIDDIEKAFEGAYADQKDEEADDKGSSSSSGGSGSGGSSKNKVTVVGVPTVTTEVLEPRLDTTKLPQTSFNDLANVAWAAEAINALRMRGVAEGDGSGAFRPFESVTRAQFLKMLLGALGVECSSDGKSFNDVAENDWYCDTVVTAKRLGIANGKDDGTFGPDDKITRADMAVFVCRAIKALGKELPLHNAAKVFRDYEKIPPYAIEDMSSLWQAGILSGDENGMCNPQNAATRAESAVIIWNLINAVKE